MLYTVIFFVENYREVYTSYCSYDSRKILYKVIIALLEVVIIENNLKSVKTLLNYFKERSLKSYYLTENGCTSIKYALLRLYDAQLLNNKYRLILEKAIQVAKNNGTYIASVYVEMYITKKQLLYETHEQFDQEYYQNYALQLHDASTRSFYKVLKFYNIYSPHIVQLILNYWLD